MSLLDQHFKEALKDLPDQKLSWWASRRICKALRRRALELEGYSPFWMTFQRLVAVPVALAILIVSVGGYGYASPSVVQSDLLYPIKSLIEQRLYPTDGSSEDRIAYHLWLSERRYAEVKEILKRKDAEPLAFIPRAFAQSTPMTDLDRILFQTLKSASAHVEIALVITKEIREVKKVSEVKKSIRKAVDDQKVFFDEVKPVLREVTLETPIVVQVEADVMARSFIPPELQNLLAFDIGLKKDRVIENVGDFVEQGLTAQDEYLADLETSIANAESAGHEMLLAADVPPEDDQLLVTQLEADLADVEQVFEVAQGVHTEQIEILRQEDEQLLIADAFVPSEPPFESMMMKTEPVVDQAALVSPAVMDTGEMIVSETVPEEISMSSTMIDSPENRLLQEEMMNPPMDSMMMTKEALPEVGLMTVPADVIVLPTEEDITKLLEKISDEKERASCRELMEKKCSGQGISCYEELLKVCVEDSQVKMILE